MARLTDQKAREARYAELLSRETEACLIREMMGLTKGQAARCLQNIRRQLGRQAV